MTYDLLILTFDDPQAEEIERFLTSKQIKVAREGTVKKAIQRLKDNSYHFVLLDQRLEGADLLI
ncbi:MAG: hypothetical protein Q4G01_08205, partial [Eubacteriales bacterium]|nr:hypothetical protein [Eubacteriales bacterium]